MFFRIMIVVFYFLLFIKNSFATNVVMAPAFPSSAFVSWYTSHEVIPNYSYWQVVHPTYPKSGVAYSKIGPVYSKYAPAPHKTVSGKIFNYDVATRVINFKFKGSKKLFDADHAFVQVAMGRGKNGLLITRGIIIGNVSRAPFGCEAPNSPSVQIESFLPVRVHLNPNKCVSMSEGKYYSVSLHVSKNWVAYWVWGEDGNLLVSDGVNASAMWGAAEKNNAILIPTTTGDYAVPEVAFGSAERSEFWVKDIEIGYYLNP